jgi:flagellar M-ring protein FliF
MFASIRNQLANFWKHQSGTQRITLGVLLIAAVIVVPMIVNWASTPSYSVAFSSLSEADAGQIVQKLQDSGVAYKLQNSGTILVPSSQVYDVRLKMASAGLPQSSTVGYELFDNTSLGINEFTQKINYQRALEGELERTISSLSSVDSVRVHIVTPEKSLLSSAQAPATASVTIKEKSGQALDAPQVRSITHLLASSIEGLQPENVVVVDTAGNLLADGSADSQQGGSSSQIDSQRAVELAASRDIQKKVQNLLDSILGPNRSVVQASVAMDWTQRETTTQSFNPTTTAIRSSQKTNETYTTTSGTVGGVPGAGSNLPTPVATLTTGNQPLIYQKNDETVNYEVSQTQSKEVIAPGQVSRISLSVMVDGVTDTAQLASLKAAAAAAAGIDDKRGDIISVDTMQFDRTYYTQQAADLSQQSNTNLYIQIGTIAAAIVAAILILWYIMRLFKNLRLASGENWSLVMRPVTETALPGNMSTNQPGITAPNLASILQSGPAYDQTQQNLPEETPLFTRSVPAKQHGEDDQMQKALSLLTEENPATVADIIQMWLNEDQKHHA